MNRRAFNQNKKTMRICISEGVLWDTTMAAMPAVAS